MTVLPIFPLGRVVLPTELIPLHIFEPRYRVLMEHLTAGSDRREMGTVLIERGHEVGGGEVRTGTGTVVALVQARQAPDGRWLAVFSGTERFAVTEWLEDDPYPRAEIERRPDPLWESGHDAALRVAEEQVRAAVELAHRLGEAPVPPGFALSDDPVIAAWELCAAAPLGSLDRQHLLEAEPGDRLEALTALTAEAATVLAYRLEPG